MIEINRRKFDQLCRKHPDYISRAIMRHEHNGRVCEKGEFCGYESVITGDPRKGTALIFQHIHFEIID